MRGGTLNVNMYFSLILLISSIIMIHIGIFSWKKNKKDIAIAFIPVVIYEMGYAFEILCTNIENVVFWIRVEYIGIVFLPVMWLIFSINFNGHKDKLKKSTLISLCIFSIITLIINYTNDFHHLFYKNIYMNNDGLFPIVEIVKGPWYWVNIAYTYILLIIGFLIFVSAYFKAVYIVRKQLLFLIIAWVIPWISDIIYMLGILPFNLDLCPLAFSFSGIISSFAILNYKLLKLTPIALEKVFSNMLDGVIILDYENNIVNFNNSSKNIIEELKDIEVGEKKIDEIFKEYKELLKAINNNISDEHLLTIKNDEQLRYFKININNIYEKNGDVIGKVLIFNDVTESEQQRKKLSDNLNFLQTLMDAIPNPIFSKNEEGVYNHCNAALTEFLGMRREDFIGKTVNELFENSLAQIHSEYDKNLTDNRGTQVYESKLIHNDGTYHDVIFSKSVVESDYENNKGLVGVVIDITEEKRNKEKINKLLKLKEAMSKIGYLINEITDINDLLQIILNEVINCIDDRSCGSVLLLDEDKNMKIAVAKGYDSQEIKTFSLKLEEHRLRFNDGEKINKTVIFNNIDKFGDIIMLDTIEGEKIRSAMSSPIVINDELYGFLNIDSIYNNIFSENDLELMEYMRNQASIAIIKHKLIEETKYLYRYDKLTNVYNRSYFEQVINKDIYSDSINKNEFLAVVFDLNNLKYVNDNYGHLIGDKLIMTFSEELIKLAGDSDIIGRYGGDEFIGIFFDVEYQTLSNKFEKLIKHFKSNPIIFEDHKIVCSYSYGIANSPRDGAEFAELVKVADGRMYEYKRKEKNTIKLN
ncbi:diguanylate cyclase [Clostridium chromiireducens]|uniref:Diguanylate cyclase n=1 Tax=Clostridium chromiireducens TaxID=225345 RepID=A0A399INR1_9CLOT|nr:histidine kinase N-terminal 7TM domain-containing protein [Clostridium chromiireducens]RII33082.1 diguanylate cyclase [Clostridium chromiireducens]